MTLPDSVVGAGFEQGATGYVHRLKRKVTQRCDRKRQFENEGVAASILGITQGYAVETCVLKMSKDSRSNLQRLGDWSSASQLARSAT